MKIDAQRTRHAGTKPKRLVVPAKKLQLTVSLAIAAVTFLAFLPVLRAHFVDLDDMNILVNNPHFRGLAWSNLRWMFTQSLYIGVYIPLSWITLAVDYCLWGMNPMGYHLTNLLLHCLNAVLCYFLARELFLAATRESSPWPALLSALFFSLHPLRVESVAWVSERRDVLSGFFFFLTLIAYLRYTAQTAPEKQKRWYGLALAFYVLLLFSKAVGITMPVLLLILDVYPLKRLRWLEKIPFLVIGIVFTVIAARAQMESGAAWHLADLGFLERAGIVFYGLAFYIRKTVWPFHLYPLHELSLPIHWLKAPFLISFLSVCAISLFLFWKRRAAPAVWAVWLAYVITLLPFSGIFQSGPQLVADRYSYLSCLGSAFLFGYFFTRRRPAAILLLAFLATLTWRQCRVWADSEALYRQIVREDPHASMARGELGNLLIARGDIMDGARYLNEAFQLKPTVTAAYNLAIACEKTSRWNDAVRLYSFVIHEDPNFLQAYNNLGLVYRRMGQSETAVFYFREALKRADMGELHFNLGLAYEDQKKWKEALREYSRALELRPDFTAAKDARRRLGMRRLIVR